MFYDDALYKFTFRLLTYILTYLIGQHYDPIIAA